MTNTLNLKDDPTALMTLMRRTHELAVSDYNEGSGRDLTCERIMEHCKCVEYDQAHCSLVKMIYNVTFATMMSGERED